MRCHKVYKKLAIFIREACWHRVECNVGALQLPKPVDSSTAANMHLRIHSFHLPKPSGQEQRRVTRRVLEVCPHRRTEKSMGCRMLHRHGTEHPILDVIPRLPSHTVTGRPVPQHCRSRTKILAAVVPEVAYDCPSGVRCS